MMQRLSAATAAAACPVMQSLHTPYSSLLSRAPALRPLPSTVKPLVLSMTPPVNPSSDIAELRRPPPGTGGPLPRRAAAQRGSA